MSDEVDFDNFPIEQQALIKEKVNRYMRKLQARNEAKQDERPEGSWMPKSRPPAEPGDSGSKMLGKYMFRDMPLFKYEFIAYWLMVIVVFMAYILDITGIAPGASGGVIIAAIILPLAFWFIKWKFYMPTRRRVPTLRIYKTGIVELGIEDITKGYLTYGRGDNLERKYITKINKHFEASTGRPIIITSELKGENLDLIGDSKPDMQGKETTALLEMNTAVTTKNVMNKMLKSMQPSLQNPTFLISIVTLAMVAVLMAKDMGLLNILGGG